MKQKTILAILGFTLISSLVFSQNEGDISQMYMTGKWTAVCPYEVVEHAAIRMCELCPNVIDPNNKSSIRTLDIEMNFKNDSLQLRQNGVVATVPILRNKYNHSFSFTLNNKDYYFRVFFYGDRRILVGKDGLIMVLEAV